MIVIFATWIQTKHICSLGSFWVLWHTHTFLSNNHPRICLYSSSCLKTFLIAIKSVVVEIVRKVILPSSMAILVVPILHLFSGHILKQCLNRTHLISLLEKVFNFIFRKLCIYTLDIWLREEGMKSNWNSHQTIHINLGNVQIRNLYLIGPFIYISKFISQSGYLVF